MRYVLSGTFFLLLTVYTADAQSSTGKGTLSQLDGVHVQVVQEERSFAEAGVSSESLKTATELALRESGIEVYTEEEARQTDASPHLLLEFYAYGGASKEVYAFSVKAHVVQKVTTEAGSTIAATTYMTAIRTGLVSRDNLEDVRTHVENEVDIFINDWLEAHYQ